MPLKHLHVCAEHLTEDGFEQHIAVRSFVGTLYMKLDQQLVHVVKKDEALTIFNFPMESCKPALGQKAKKNKHKMPAQQWTKTPLPFPK